MRHRLPDDDLLQSKHVGVSLSVLNLTKMTNSRRTSRGLVPGRGPAVEEHCFRQTEQTYGQVVGPSNGPYVKDEFANIQPRQKTEYNRHRVIKDLRNKDERIRCPIFLRQMGIQ